MKRFGIFLCTAVLLLLSAVPHSSTQAFDSIAWSQTHQEITAKALGSFLKPDVLSELANANGFLYDFTRFPFSDVHFDDCNFSGSINNINSQYNLLIGFALEKDERTIETFGHILHTAQDFYAHSNWVNLGFNNLFEDSNTLWFGGSSPKPFTPLENYMILQGEDSSVPKGLVLQREFNSKVITVMDTNTSTSYPGVVTGFFSSVVPDDCPDSVAIGHYDQTYPIPGTVTPVQYRTEFGLNKDTPEQDRYNQAYNLAVLQTQHEWCRLVTLVLKEDGLNAAADLVVNWVQPDKAQEALTNCQGLKISVDSTATELLNLITGKLDTHDTTRPLDLVFVIDTTSSMEDDIDQAKEHAQEIIDQIAASGLNWRLALVTFRDYPDGDHGETTDYQSKIESGFTTDAGFISSTINAIVVAGGADGPESVYSGLMDAMSLDWREGAQKVVVLLGDAPPQDPEPHTGYTRQMVLERAFNLDPVNMYPILISDNGEARRAFAALADGSSGRIFNARSAEDVVPTLLSTIETATGDTHLTIGGYARVFTTGGDLLNLRQGTSTRTEILTKMPLGTIVKIVGGPEFVYPYIWWSVEAPNGQVGYAVEAADGIVTLVNIPAEELATIDGLCVGTPTEVVSIHARPNVSASSTGTLTEPAEIVSQHPAGKYTWYELSHGGWVHGDFVALSGDCSDLGNK